jgi:hypothetical protein
MKPVGAEPRSFDTAGDDLQMRYLVSVIDDKSNPGSTDRQPAISAFNERLIAEGYWVSRADWRTPTRPRSSTTGAKPMSCGEGVERATGIEPARISLEDHCAAATAAGHADQRRGRGVLCGLYRPRLHRPNGTLMVQLAPEDGQAHVCMSTVTP